MEGVRIAALEIFEESLNSERLQRQISRLKPDDQQILKLLPTRKLADGYYDWACYLLWLRNKMGAGVKFAEIFADEAEGLSAISLAMQDFEREHPHCPACGQRGYKGMRRCPHCSRELS